MKGKRWKEGRTGCPAFLSNFIVIGGSGSAPWHDQHHRRLSWRRPENRLNLLLEHTALPQPVAVRDTDRAGNRRYAVYPDQPGSGPTSAFVVVEYTLK